MAVGHSRQDVTGYFAVFGNQYWFRHTISLSSDMLVNDLAV